MELKDLQNMKPRFVSREVGEELILVPLTNNVAQMNELFTLNSTARFIWENAERTHSAPEMAALITESFDIDRETAQKDIGLFLEKISAFLTKK